MRTKLRPFLVLFCVLLFTMWQASSAFGFSAALGFLNDVLGGAEAEGEKSSQRLASGRVLLTDDPASYSIYDSLEAQVRALGAEIRNEADMLSYYRLQDAMLGVITDVMQRIRELLIQRANGILSSLDLEAIDAEIAQLYDQVVETLREAEFNQKKIFLPLDAAAAKGFFSESRYRDLQSVDQLMGFLIRERTSIGASMETLEFTISGQETENLNTYGSLSQSDTEFGKELVALERSHLLVLADILMLKRELR